MTNETPRAPEQIHVPDVVFLRERVLQDAAQIKHLTERNLWLATKLDQMRAEIEAVKAAIEDGKVDDIEEDGPDAE